MIPKFRAWDKADREMIPWNRLLNGHNLRNVFMRPEMCGLILMQSTGLKDKNGVEVFEGDIVKGEQYLTTRVPTAITEFVEYSERNTGFYVVNKTSNHERYKQTLGASIYQYEIIGNIYQHPELLEGELE